MVDIPRSDLSTLVLQVLEATPPGTVPSVRMVRTALQPLVRRYEGQAARGQAISKELFWAAVEDLREHGYHLTKAGFSRPYPNMAVAQPDGYWVRYREPQ